MNSINSYLIYREDSLMLFFVFNIYKSSYGEPLVYEVCEKYYLSLIVRGNDRALLDIYQG